MWQVCSEVMRVGAIEALNMYFTASLGCPCWQSTW